MKAFKYFLMATAVVTFLLVVMGNVVRVSDAAFACPDWPTCYGQYTFPADTQAQLQVLHRGLAALSGLMVLAAAVWAKRRQAAGLVWGALAAALPLMAVEILSGGGFIQFGAAAALAGLHLGLALAVLGLVTLAATAAYGLSFVPMKARFQEGEQTAEAPSTPETAWQAGLGYFSGFSKLTLLAGLAVFLVLLSGAVVASSGSAQVCSGWPLCEGGWPVSASGWFEIGHRGLTLAAALLVSGLFWQAWRTQRSQRVILTAATGLFILFLGQVLIGAAKVTRGFPADLVGLHAASAAALWAVWVVLAVRSAARFLPPATDD